MTTEILDIPVARADGSTTSLAEFAGRVLLVVNTASKCGLTPQYEGLEALYRDHAEAGLTVVGFPANDFFGQEPGTDAEIQTFCQTSFGVDFPVMAKISVTGEAIHPLYAALIDAVPQASFKPDSGFLARLAKHGHVPEPRGINWNFEKFLIGRDGQVVGRYAPDTLPQDPEIVDAIRDQLAR